MDNMPFPPAPLLPEPQPIRQAPLSASPEAESTSFPLAQSRSDAIPAEPVVRSESQVSEEIPPPRAAPEPQGAVEKLIESTVLPEPSPGLEMRLASPRKTGLESETVFPERSRADDSILPPSAPDSTAQIDINEVTDRVYLTLQRRQQLERERKGLY